MRSTPTSVARIASGVPALTVITVGAMRVCDRSQHGNFRSRSKNFALVADGFTAVMRSNQEN
jgi:hypothetical protein